MKVKFKILLAFLLTGIAAFSQTKPQIDPAFRKNILRSTGDALNNYYVFPEKGKATSGYINEQYEKGRYDSLNDPKALAGQLTRDIRSVHNDNHIRIEYDPGLEKDILKFLSSKTSAQKVSEADLAKDEQRNFYFKKAEILPSNIGYVEFTGFANPGPSARKTIYAAMQFIAHTDAVIIDLRNNFGGNGTTADEIAGYFLPARTYSGKSFNRIENKWTEQYIENKKAITNGLSLNMPVYILTSNRTYSAAEGLAYNLKNLRNAIIVGDTTRGGAHLTRSFSLGNGFVAFIPYLRTENAVTKTDWEGKGVTPDLSAEESNCLAIAQNAILSKKLAAATSEIEKRKITWIMNYNRSKQSTVVIDPSETLTFTGRFAEFEVSLQEGHLMFRDTNQPGKNYKKMTAIASRFFQVGNDYQVEFIMENNGSYSSIQVSWDDGWSETIKRSE